MGWQAELLKIIGKLSLALRLLAARAAAGLANQRRRLFYRGLPDYLVIVLDQTLTERTPYAPWWTAYIPGLQPPLSLEEIDHKLQRIADDPDVQGVVVILRAPELSLARAQSLAQLFDRFRGQAGLNSTGATKQVVVHLEQINNAAYVAACAADRITIAPLTTWEVRGFQIVQTYFKETLARLGVEFEVARVAPWKSAADNLSRSSMSDAQRAQLNWLLDSLFDDMLGTIGERRGLSRESIAKSVDSAPLTAEEARASGLVDDIAYEDELPTLLGSPQRPARLRSYADAGGLLLRRPRPLRARAVGVLDLQGAIIAGRSRQFPIPLPILGQRVIGSATLQQQIRAARNDDRLGAVVVVIDSPGGSALGSDLIWRELSLLDREKPLVVFMGNIAASGGYYIALPGRKIVAQPATLTGSVGVVVAKPVTKAAYAKAGATQESVYRGAAAGLYGSEERWSTEQRQKVDDGIAHVYGEFKQRVAVGRQLHYDTLDPLCHGRVWTGAQAYQHGLIDELGDFRQALDMACRLAELPTDGTVRAVGVKPPSAQLVAAAAEDILQALGLTGLRRLGRLAEAALVEDLGRKLCAESYWLIAEELPDIR